MTNTTTPAPEKLTPADYTRQRDQSMTEGVKGLFIINGGAALALLAFFKDVWKDQPALASYMLKSISLLVLGVALAGAVHLVRYQASFVYQSKGSEEGVGLRRAYLTLAGASLGAFFVAMVFMIVGMWSVMLK